MSQWVRLWEDMPNDPKWVVIARRASQGVTPVSVCFVVGVFVHMLTKADQNGDLENWCDEDIAASLQISTEHVSAVFKAMQGKVLDGNHLKGWSKRQPKREDSSTERVRAFRARQNTKKQVVTARNAPEEKRIESDLKKPSVFFNARETRSKTKNLKTQIQEKAKPTPSQAAAATERGLTEAERMIEWEKFKNHHRANGNTFVDWLAAWCMWLDKRGNGQSRGPPNGHATTPQIFVKEDTPQWNAWEDFYRKTKGSTPPKADHGKDGKGWHFKTEWPPNV